MEERTAPGLRRAKNPRDDLAIPPLLPRQKSSHITRTVSEDYKGIDLAEFVRLDVLFGILRGLNRNTTIRVWAGTKNSRPVGFLL